MTNTINRVALALAMGLGAGCSSSSGEANITVLLTDAPATLKAAVVTITEIDLEGPAGVTVLSTAKTTTNLLTLAATAATLVNATPIEPGTYEQLRFVITGGYVAVDDGAGGTQIFASSPTYEGLPSGATVAGTLKMPSYAESGLKIDLPGGALTVGIESKVLLVDFNVEQSFGHGSGGSGSWVMHPVVTATDVTLSGTLNVKLALGAGVALPVVNMHQVTLADFSAVLTFNGVSKTVALVAGGGTFGASFKFLAPGAYTVTLTAAGVTFTTSPSVPTTVNVLSGQATEVDFTLKTAITP